MSQYWAAGDTVAKLQTEKAALQLQLRSLQHHLSLHREHVRSMHDNTEETKRQADARLVIVRLLEEHRKALVASHSTSVNGSFANEYRAVLMEHIYLEDRFRRLEAVHVVTRYDFQKRVMDRACAYFNATAQTVCGFSYFGRSPPISLP